jgi:hypothetical protein
LKNNLLPFIYFLLLNPKYGIPNTGVMDKKCPKNDHFCSSGQKVTQIFHGIFALQFICFNFVLSNKTETGSAGEQPVRDSLTCTANYGTKGCF